MAVKLETRLWWCWLSGLLLIVTLTFGLGTTAYGAGRTKIVFWHEMTGPAQAQLMTDAKAFNASQSKYEVVPEFEGSYNEAVQKILHTHGTSAAPALFQSMDVSTAQLYHANVATPVQKFIDADHYDVSQISSVARAFYSQNGKQISMPFNTSQPVLYYNASLLKRLGIKAPPVNPTYSDITRVAKAITAKSNGKVKGLTVEVYGWLFEQFMANGNTVMANQNNGRSGYPTTVDFTSTATQKAMAWIRENIQAKDFIDFGAGSQAESNEIAAFLAGKLGMFVQSSAYISQLLAGTKDQLGITYYPHADGTKANGVSIGGASLWIANSQPKNVQQGAWQFIKYVMTPQAQAAWQKATGYLALNQKSQHQAILKQLYAKQPVAKVPSEQLAAATANPANSGIFMEGLLQERTLTQTAMATIYNGGNITSALKTAETSMNQYLANNNRANQYTNH